MPEGCYLKRLQCDRSVANDLRSFKRYLHNPVELALSFDDVANKAIIHAIYKDPIISTLAYMGQRNRQNGAKLELNINHANWYALQGLVDSLAKISEYDLMEHAFRTYLAEIKTKGMLV